MAGVKGKSGGARSGPHTGRKSIVRRTYRADQAVMVQLAEDSIPVQATWTHDKYFSELRTINGDLVIRIVHI